MAGTILVPTPHGNVPMTLEQARQYQATHTQGFTDPTNPNVSPQIQQAIQDPRIQQAIQSGASTQVKVGETTFRISNGQVTHYSTGSLWKPIAAALLTAAGGYYGGQLLAGSGATGAGTSGAVGTSGTAATGVLPATATVPTSTGTVAGLTGGTGLGTTAATGSVGTAGASGLLPSTPTVPNVTGGPVAGLPSWASAGGAPSVAPSVGGSLTKALLNPSVLGAGIGTAGQLFGAHMAASGATEAAKIQAAYLEKALAYEKQRDAYQQQLEASRYGNIQQHLGPYMQLGESAAARIQKLLGGGALPSLPTAPVAPTPQDPYYQRGPGTPGGPPSGRAVPR